MLEPVRPARRVRGDDDQVGPEGAEPVLDRLDRVGVTDLAPGPDAKLLELGDATAEPLLGGCSSLVIRPTPSA